MIRVLVWLSLLLQTADCLLYPYVGKGGHWSLYPLIRSPVPSWGSTPMTSSEPKYTKALLPNTIALGVKASAYELEEDPST